MSSQFPQLMKGEVTQTNPSIPKPGPARGFSLFRVSCLEETLLLTWTSPLLEILESMNVQYFRPVPCHHSKDSLVVDITVG